MGGPEQVKSETWRTAIFRSVYGGVLTGAGVWLTTYTATQKFQPSLLAASSALVAYLLARGAVEGWVDTRTP